MIIKKLKGFKYPDIELVRWFFKGMNLSFLLYFVDLSAVL